MINSNFTQYTIYIVFLIQMNTAMKKKKLLKTVKKNFIPNFWPPV